RTPSSSPTSPAPPSPTRPGPTTKKETAPGPGRLSAARRCPRASTVATATARADSARAAGDDHREAVVLPEAVDVGEARLAQPVELVLHRGGAVDAHPLDRGQPLLVGGAVRLRPALVPALVGVVEEGGRAGDLLGVDEDAAGPEPLVQAAEQRRLPRVVEVVDREGADDRVPGLVAREGVGEV